MEIDPILIQWRWFAGKSKLSIRSTYAMLILNSQLKHYVLTGGWRKARYLSEPGLIILLYLFLILTNYSISIGPVNGYMNRYATDMETIA